MCRSRFTKREFLFFSIFGRHGSYHMVRSWCDRMLFSLAKYRGWAFDGPTIAEDGSYVEPPDFRTMLEQATMNSRFIDRLKKLREITDGVVV